MQKNYAITKKAAQSSQAVQRQKAERDARQRSDCARAGDAPPDLCSGEAEARSNFRGAARRRGASDKETSIAAAANRDAVLGGIPVLHGKSNLSKEDRQAIAIGQQFAADKINADPKIKGGIPVIKASKEAGEDARKTILDWGFGAIGTLFDLMLSDPQKDRRIAKEAREAEARQRTQQLRDNGLADSKDILYDDWANRYQERSMDVGKSTSNKPILYRACEPIEVVQSQVEAKPEQSFWGKVFNPPSVWDSYYADEPEQEKPEVPIICMSEAEDQEEERGFWSRFFLG